MAITLKHGGNVAPLVIGAYGGGQGRRQAEDTRAADSLLGAANRQERQLIESSNQAALSRQSAVDAANANRDFVAGQNGLRNEGAASLAESRRIDSEDYAASKSLSGLYESRDKIKQMTSYMPGVSPEVLSYASNLSPENGEALLKRVSEGDIEFDISDNDRKRFEKINHDIDALRKSGIGRPSETLAVIEALQKEALSIGATPKLRSKKQPNTERVQVGMTWVDQNPDGTKKTVGGIMPKDFMDISKSAMEAATKTVDVEGPMKDGKPTFEPKTSVDWETYFTQSRSQLAIAAALQGLDPEIARNPDTGMGFDQFIMMGISDEKERKRIAQKYGLLPPDPVDPNSRPEHVGRLAMKVGIKPEEMLRYATEKAAKTGKSIAEIYKIIEESSNPTPAGA